MLAFEKASLRRVQSRWLAQAESRAEEQEDDQQGGADYLSAPMGVGLGQQAQSYPHPCGDEEQEGKDNSHHPGNHCASGPVGIQKDKSEQQEGAGGDSG